jgi:transposase
MEGQILHRQWTKTLRDALYMPGLVAMRCNLDLKEKCTCLRTVGKPAKVAITQVMRNFIEMVGALVRQNHEWTPKTA